MKRVIVGIYVDERVELLPPTLSSIAAHTPETHERLLLIDGADLAMREEISSLASVPKSISRAAVGAPAAFNRLVNHEPADVYVFLESGAMPGPAWLTHLLAAFEADARIGLAGPSTNHAWNQQCAFRGADGEPGAIARTAQTAAHRFGSIRRTLEPLYSLADFCYVVKRQTIDAVGPADENYGRGPCWEMDYNIRAARAGWRGVWVCGAYVHRAPFTETRRRKEDLLFEASKQRYQDKFCGARLRGDKTDYRSHCRGDACPNFAPPALMSRIGTPADLHALTPPGEIPHSESPTSETPADLQSAARSVASITPLPLVTCIMPTCDRLQFVPGAIQCFLQQDYPHLEMIVVDDGVSPVASLLPDDPRFRLIRLPAKRNIGAKRNIACAAASGEFIVHWDDDDWYPRDRVSRQVAVLRTARCEISGTSTLYYHDAQTSRTWRYRYETGRRPWVAGNTLAYRIAWWKAHPFPEIQVGEDSRFIWTAPLHAVRDLAAPDLCVARIHVGNTSRKVTTGPCWEPRPSAEVAVIVGADWPGFPSPSGATPAGNNGPLVSCIMPTCNRRALLRLALRAYAAQDYPARELIVVDDGTDPVDDLVAAVAGARYVQLPGRQSIGEKRNRACAEARGEIIAHWDDDDWYAPSRLRLQVAPLLAQEADLTGLENTFMLELPAARFWRTHPTLHRRMFVGDVHGGTLVYWKKILTSGVRYPPVNIAEDAALIKAALQRGQRLRRVANDGVFVYMRHGRNAWQFQSGGFLDPHGWELIAPPATFSAAELAEWQDAVAAMQPA